MRLSMAKMCAFFIDQMQKCQQKRLDRNVAALQWLKVGAEDWALDTGLMNRKILLGMDKIQECHLQVIVVKIDFPSFCCFFI